MHPLALVSHPLNLYCSQGNTDTPSWAPRIMEGPEDRCGFGCLWSPQFTWDVSGEGYFPASSPWLGSSGHRSSPGLQSGRLSLGLSRVLSLSLLFIFWAPFRLAC